jgi:hypothetical protein
MHELLSYLNQLGVLTIMVSPFLAPPLT